MSDSKVSCPTLLDYSYFWNGRPTAVSTDQFLVKSATTFTTSITFRNNTGLEITLGRPQLWTNVLPQDGGEGYQPGEFFYEVPEGAVARGAEFTLKISFETDNVPEEHRTVTIRPQLAGGGWYNPFDVASPIVKYEFQCATPSLDGIRIFSIPAGVPASDNRQIR
ncbi:MULTISPECIES: hypothetical protein [Pseudomonas]|uniref:Uncharacterized protein n=1 Tax=Pseudomonas peradeniyensis TaxID=2745488 RepID=A0ABT2V7I1_9PSED|nr:MULTISPECIES: hypothetical protein [Pseudomonas]MCU7237661.1 hypothetical protein [Pseudomonas peradeniyensis]MCU7278595.1 hypothetical protein [Pseudomonas peradeniyensis]QZA54556.1 hypothetical protein K2O50_00380 [Pseudomonas sp. 2hn]